MLDFFDIYEYLNDRGIDYSETGTNTSKGWVNIRCPFPHCGDRSNHLGINLASKAFHCWKCGEHGSIIILLQELEGCTKREAEAIIEQFQNIDDLMHYENTPSDVVVAEGFQYPPKGIVDTFPEIHLQYLRNRNFDPNLIIPKYKLLACHTLGRFKFRIIIPVIQDGRIVNFVSRAVIKDLKPRYKNASAKDLPIIELGDLLYNIDYVNDRALILEGPTDVWNVGDGSICTFGTAVSKAQMSKLAQLDLVVLVFDSEAMEDAERLEYQIRPFVNTEIVELDSGLDPAMLTQDEVLDLKREFSI